MNNNNTYTYNYPRPMVCTDCIIIAPETGNNCILLIKRGNDPFKGMWALPGGFVDMDEDLEESALRELKEETGIELTSLEQFRAYGKPGRDPRGRTISVIFFHISQKPLTAKAGDDAAEAKWFDLDNLPNLAFDHEEIIRTFSFLNFL